MRGDIIAELPLRLKIYKYLVEGYAKERIAQILKKPKSLIHYHVKKLEEENIVRRVPGSKNPILYTRGINYLKAENQLKKYGENADHQGWLIVQASPQVRYHRIGYRFKVQKPPSKQPPWQRQWQASGVQYSEMTISLENGGKWDRNIRIREIKGKNSSSIVIWLPEYICESKEELEQAVKLKEQQAIKVANFLQKNFGYQLGLIEEYQEPHFAIPIPKHVAEAAVRAGIRTEKVWIDVSDGGELETDDTQTAVTLMSLPEITAQLARRADDQEKRILMLETALKNMVEFAIHQTEVIDALQRIIANAKISIGNAEELLGYDRPDERRDVV